MAIKRESKQEIQTKKYTIYYALMDFNIGKVGPHENLPIRRGDCIEYNGESIRHNGFEYPCPSFRGAVLRNWVSENSEQSPPEKRSDVVVTPLHSKEDKNKFSMNVVNQEERVVGVLNKETMRVERLDDDESEVVAVLGTPNTKTVVDGKTDFNRRLNEMSKPPKIKKVKSAKQTQISATENKPVIPPEVEKKREERIKQFNESMGKVTD